MIYNILQPNVPFINNNFLMSPKFSLFIKRICHQHQKTRNDVIYFSRYSSKRSKASLSDLIPGIKTGKYIIQNFFQTFSFTGLCVAHSKYVSFDKCKKQVWQVMYAFILNVILIYFFHYRQ